MYIWGTDTAIVHIGNELKKWVGFPSEVTSLTTLKSNMQENESVMFYFKEAIYILDGENYLKYDGTNLIDVSSIAYIPTTTISRSPSRRWRDLRRCKCITAKKKELIFSRWNFNRICIRCNKYKLSR